MQNGKEYTGLLTPVMRAGGSAMFHLMVNNYYWGRLTNNGCCFNECEHSDCSYKCKDVEVEVIL